MAGRDDEDQPAWQLEPLPEGLLSQIAEPAEEWLTSAAPVWRPSGRPRAAKGLAGTHKGAAPAWIGTADVPTEIFVPCWRAFEQNLLACAPPARDALLRCMGPSPTLVRAQQCAELAAQSRDRCTRRASLEFLLCISTDDDYLKRRTAVEFEKLDAAREALKNAYANAQNGLNTGAGAAGALTGVCFELSSAGAIFPYAAAGAFLLGLTISLAGSGYAMSYYAQEDPPRDDFAAASDVTWLRVEQLGDVPEAEVAPFAQMMISQLTLTRTTDAITTSFERLDGAALAGLSAPTLLRTGLSQIDAIQQAAFVASVAIDELVAAANECRDRIANWQADFQDRFPDGEIRASSVRRAIRTIVRDRLPEWAPPLGLSIREVQRLYAAAADVGQNLADRSRIPGEVLPQETLDALTGVAVVLDDLRAAGASVGFA